MDFMVFQRILVNFGMMTTIVLISLGAYEDFKFGEIREFCEHRYGVTFEIFDKVKIRGHDAHPMYNFLEALN